MHWHVNLIQVACNELAPMAVIDLITPDVGELAARYIDVSGTVNIRHSG